MGVITPKRAEENEASIAKLADQLIDRFIDRGSVELYSEYATPLAALTVADLLGVPPEDQDKIVGPNPAIPPGGIGADRSAGDAARHLALTQRVKALFTGYIEERRRNPARDALSHIAQVRYSDGSLPPVEDVVSLANLLFVAARGSTAAPARRSPGPRSRSRSSGCSVDSPTCRSMKPARTGARAPLRPGAVVFRAGTGQPVPDLHQGLSKRAGEITHPLQPTNYGGGA